MSSAGLHRGRQHLGRAKHEVLAGERLAAEVVHAQDGQRALVDRPQDPFERGLLDARLHLGEGGMLLLEAVGASQVARQRGHQRDMHRVGDSLGGALEERAQVRVVFRARADQEHFLEQRFLHLALGRVRRTATARPALHRIQDVGVDADVVIGEDAVEHVLAGSHVAVGDHESRQQHAALLRNENAIAIAAPVASPRIAAGQSVVRTDEPGIEPPVAGIRATARRRSGRKSGQRPLKPLALRVANLPQLIDLARVAGILAGEANSLAASGGS